MSARFRWPSQRLWATDLKKKLVEKKKKREPGKGLFVFPVQSRVTGAKYSYQWMSQAQENGWDILLDASALGPNAMGSLGLSVFRPDFIVSSFFKVYGSNPTGFGCLLIKRSAIQRLHSSTAARGVGMVKLVSASSLPERLLKRDDVREVEIVAAGSSRFTEKRQIGTSRTVLSLSEKFHMADDCRSASELLSGKQGSIAHREKGNNSNTLPSKQHGVRGHEASSSNMRMLANDSPVYSLSTDRIGHGEVSTSPNPSPSKRDGVRGHEASSFNMRMLGIDSPAYSCSAGRIGHYQVSTSFNPSPSKRHGVTGHEAPRMPANEFPAYIISFEGIGHVEVSTSLNSSPSKRHGVKGHKSSSSSSRMQAKDSPAYRLSSEPQQKRSNFLDNIDSFQAPEQELLYGISQRLDVVVEDEMSSSESRPSTGFESSRGNEGPLNRSLHQSQPSYLPSFATIVGGRQDDSSFGYSEEISTAFFLDDDDFEDVSVPSNTAEEDGDDKAFFIERKEPEIECRGLQHVYKLGLIRTNTRLRCLTNWLIASMLRLCHPGSPTSHRLVQIYGPKVDYNRGASVAFNLTDWKGNLLQPLLVQRLADRSNISLGVTTLNHIYLPKSSAKWPSYVQHLNSICVNRGHTGEAKSVEKASSFDVITVAICFLSNFEDVYKFWLFLANFLDADFVSKEVWRYRSLNQETVVLGMEVPRKA